MSEHFTSLITFGAISRYCRPADSLVRKRKALSWSTYTPWWFVLKLSICFLSIDDQKSVQINVMVSNSSLNLGHSLVNLKADFKYRWTYISHISETTLGVRVGGRVVSHSRQQNPKGGKINILNENNYFIG